MTHQHREEGVAHWGLGWFKVGVDGDHAVVTAGGEIDMDSAVGLGQAIGEALSRSSSLVVDLSRVTFMDSTGLGVLISARNRTRDSGGSVALVQPPDMVRKILVGTRLQRSFSVFDSLEDALGASAER